jgi:hypothetical protein
MAQSPKMKAAKTAYFDNRTAADAVGAEAVKQLKKKWGRFRLVTSRSNADLIFLLTADAYKGGYIVLANGQTGTMNDGKFEEDGVPNYNAQAPVRDVYLSVIDPKDGSLVWSESHIWGGVLTGVNSAGARLVKK